VSEGTRKYLESHEWALVEGDAATVGLSEFAVNHLSDLVFIQMPEVGDKVEQGESFGEIESVKAVSEINAPLSGEIAEVNETVAENLELISSDPLGDGWLVKIKIDDPSELENLLGEKEYLGQLEEEETDDDLPVDPEEEDEGED